MAKLTREERLAYETEGYVVPSYRVPEARMAALAAATEEVIAANPDTRPEQLPNVHVTNGAGTHLKGHPAFLDAALDDDLLDLASCVLGEDLVMWGCQIFCKPGADGMEVPMHQDGQYWPSSRSRRARSGSRSTTPTARTGASRSSRGSHRGRTHFRHGTRTGGNLVLNQAVDDPRATARPPAFVELRRGRISMHDVYLVHGSAPNTSGRRRAGLALRYMPTTSWFRRDRKMSFSGYPSNFADRPIWLARGRDVCGRNDFTIGRSDAGTARAGTSVS